VVVSYIISNVFPYPTITPFLDILFHLFMYMLGIISKYAINESAWLWLNVNGHYSLNRNGEITHGNSVLQWLTLEIHK
jgi:hypothetical protein